MIWADFFFILVKIAAKLTPSGLCNCSYVFLDIFLTLFSNFKKWWLYAFFWAIAHLLSDTDYRWLFLRTRESMRARISTAANVIWCRSPTRSSSTPPSTRWRRSATTTPSTTGSTRSPPACTGTCASRRPRSACRERHRKPRRRIPVTPTVSDCSGRRGHLGHTETSAFSFLGEVAGQTIGKYWRNGEPPGKLYKICRHATWYQSLWTKTRNFICGYGWVVC